MIGAYMGFKVGDRVEVYVNGDMQPITEPERGKIVLMSDIFGFDMGDNDFQCIRYDDGTWASLKTYWVMGVVKHEVTRHD